MEGLSVDWLDYERNVQRVGREIDQGRYPYSRDPDEAGYVYLAKCGPYYKIGKSKYPTKRLAQIALQMPWPLREVAVWHTETMSTMERNLHLWWAHRRRNGEWFEFTDFDLQILADQASTYTLEGMPLCG